MGQTPSDCCSGHGSRLKFLEDRICLAGYLAKFERDPSDPLDLSGRTEHLVRGRVGQEDARISGWPT